MTQRDRDRLVVLKKTQKKAINQLQAAVEPQLGERRVRRLLVRLGEVGDRLLVGPTIGRLRSRRQPPPKLFWFHRLSVVSAAPVSLRLRR